MTHPTRIQTDFGRGTSLPLATTVPAETRRAAASRSCSPLVVARRVCEWGIDALGIALCVLCAWWGIEPEDL